MNYRLLLVLLFLYLASCTTQPNKQYYYVEDGKEELLKAPSDSVAYKKAFEQYQISLKRYHDQKTKLGDRYNAKRPHFILLDSAKQNITYEVSFATKADYETEIAEKYQK